MTPVEEPHGIYPMLYAFFGANGQLDRGAIRAEIEAVVAQGVHGVAVGGLASEVNKLSTTERWQLMEWALADVSGRIPVCVTVAENTTEGQIEMVRAANGARGRMGHPAATTGPGRQRGGADPLLRLGRTTVRIACGHSGMHPSSSESDCPTPVCWSSTGATPISPS